MLSGRYNILLLSLMSCAAVCYAQESIKTRRMYPGYALHGNDTFRCEVYFPEQLPYPQKINLVTLYFPDTIMTLQAGIHQITGFGFRDNHKQYDYGVLQDTLTRLHYKAAFVLKLASGRINLYKDEQTEYLYNPLVNSGTYSTQPTTGNTRVNDPNRSKKTIRSSTVNYYIDKQDSSLQHAKPRRLKSLSRKYLAPYLEDNPELLAIVPEKFSKKELERFVRDYNYWWKLQKKKSRYMQQYL